ncbi:hypothetical protein NLG42_21550 [Flavobacterium plurextorum]|uniref:hypothetical protein n=1 Tax=Flavobacterium TaxID=237 RepID=UPI00214D33E3|nr:MULTISPECIES: hypothetical protein [Flavobacterium]UUW08677.1 hypothetical protein NLG42_21550 [Flavobacterium plurextorum]
MDLTIANKSQSICGKYNFSIYSHTLTLEELDSYILDTLFEEKKLNYLFQKDLLYSKKQGIIQLQKFIETSFANREDEVTDEEINDFIDQGNNIKSYYSFFAEALLARLNIDYIDNDLVIGVIAVNENLTKVSTGADVCMFSNSTLVLGEAKFYGELYGGITSIITDSSFKSKLEDYIKNIISSTSEIIIKGITGDICEKTSADIKKMPLVLSGFVLHTKDNKDKYDSAYNLINNVSISDFPEHYKIHLYHLPIDSKKKLIFKAQRKALNLIINLKTNK